jgi:WG containing repeat
MRLPPRLLATAAIVSVWAMIAVVLLMLTTLFSVNHASEQSSRLNTAGPRQPDDSEPCLFGYERGQVPNCIRKTKSGALFVAPQYLKELDFDRHGLAVVLSNREGWMYVDRTGRVVITGVARMDNWADEFHDGLVRVVKNGRWGFADRKGHIVIAPIYDGALDFENGRATVCRGCKTTSDGEHSWFTGGQWYELDTKGTVLRRLPPGGAK